MVVHLVSFVAVPLLQLVPRSDFEQSAVWLQEM